MHLRFVQDVKKSTNRFFLPIVKFLDRLHCTPLLLTSLSFLSGLASVYFLFMPMKFIPFAFLHILFDILDGHLARYQKKTSKLGSYLDYGNDRLIELFTLLQIARFYPLVYVIVVLYVMHQLLYLRFKTNLFYGRTWLFLYSIFRLYAIGAVFVGGLYLLGILTQLKEIYIKHR